MKVFRQQRKIMSPVLPPTTLHRASLVTRFNEIIAGSSTTNDSFHYYKLVLLQAPAGYGKTVALAEFAQRTSLPCCWYFLDRTDNDKTIFLQTFIASIRQCFPQFGLNLDSLLTAALSANSNASAEQHYRAVVEAIATAIATDISEHFAFFLCNYQEINASESMRSLINLFLHDLPPNCVFVIESRVMPNLNFANLLARREMFGIGSDLLRFTAQEIRDLAHLQGVTTFSDAEAEQLAVSFDGWITGMLLGTRLGDVQLFHSNTSTQIPQDASGLSSQQLLFAYLVHEVFGSDADMYTFLKDVCILQEINPSFCAEMLHVSDAMERLQYLENQGLFVTHNGEDENITYTCHPVLRDLLRAELRSQCPERFIQLHQQAARLFGKIQNYEQAIYHALEGSVDDIAAQLIIDSYEPMVAQGQRETLARWIDGLSTVITARYPRVLLIRAHIYLSLADYTNALPLLDKATEAVASLPSTLFTEEIPLIQAEIVVARAKALFQQGEYRQAQKLCQQVLEHLPSDEVALRAEIYMRLGTCANFLGDLTDSIVQSQKALQLWGRHTMGRHIADVHSVLAITYDYLGNFVLAEHHLARAVACWDHLQDPWGKVMSLIWMGIIKQHHGSFVEAETALTQALALARGPIQFERGQAYALNNLGEIYQEQGLYDRALATSEDGLAIARRLKDNYLTNGTLCDLAMTYLFMGDAVTASLLVSETDIQETIGFEQAKHDVTYATILLYQHRYGEAYVALREVEVLLQSIGLRREQILVGLRIAAYHLAQEELSEVLHRLQEVTTALAQYDGYERHVLAELGRLSQLELVVKTRPEMAHLRVLLHITSEEQEQQTVASPLPGQFITVFLPLKTQQAKLSIQALGEPVVLLEEQPITRWRMA